MEASRGPLRRRTIAFITAFFFLSGLCGLMYQIIWTRVLGLVFGHTTFAISTVITAFMAGLALGSYVLGRWSDRIDEKRAPGRESTTWGASPQFLMYGMLEAVIGAYCLLTPLLFKVIELIYLKCSGLPFYPLSLVRFLLSMAVLIIPTFCMGGTLPLISKFLIRSHGEIGRKLGFLYFINTLGAVTGTVLAGFFLIRIFGISATLRSAAAINLGIGALVYLLNRKAGSIYEGVTVEGEGSPPREDAGGGASSPAMAASGSPDEAGYSRAVRLIVVIFAFTGFASMVYELAWTRALSLAMGSSTYAFSTMLATFLFGIALGSIIYSSQASRRFLSPSLFGWLQVFIGLSCIVAIPLLGALPLIFIRIFPFIRHSYTSIVCADFLLSFVVMIIPTTLMGIAFPFAGKLYTGSLKSLGKSVGTIYAVNTIGCILGSFLTGFVLIPFIGIQNCLKVAVLINLLGGLVFLVAYYTRPLQRGLCGALVLVALLVAHFLPPWNTAVMSSGSAVYAGSYDQENASFDNDSLYKILFYRDGISATVAVGKTGSLIFLRINGKTDASTSDDMFTQLLSGYLPCLYHKGTTKEVNIIGLGSGMSARAALDDVEVRSVTCTELEPAVIEANSFFTPFNGHLFSNPRFKCAVADGRNFLLASDKRYDVIISEPSNPWVAGMANLFTTEYYTLCRDRLKDDGILCGWLQLYSLSPSDVAMILKTFFSVFPHGAVWRGAPGDILLLGSKKELSFDYGRYEKLFNSNEPFRNELQGIGITSPDVLLAHYICSSKEIAGLCQAAPANTDDHPSLEFSAPLSLYMDTILMNIRGIYSCKTRLVPEGAGTAKDFSPSADFYLRLIGLVKKSDGRLADRLLTEALALYPEDTRLLMLRK
jgi:spermidine synthase